MVSSPQHEPTMEEILASIRKIISEDSTEAQPLPEPPRPVPPAPPAAPAPAMAAEADVLELTQEVEEAPPMPAPTPEPVRQAPPPPPENDLVFESIEEPEPVAMDHTAAPTEDGIFSEENRRALGETLAGIKAGSLAAAPAPAAPFAPSGQIDGASVQAVFEQAVREAFAPVVSQWLATNADAIVERMKPLVQEWMNEHFAALLRDMVRDELTRAEHMKPLIHARLDERFPEILGAVRGEVERMAKANFGKR